MLLPLDPGEVIGEEKPRSRKTYATLVALTLVCVAMVAAYFRWDAVSPHKSANRTPERQPDNDEQAVKIPQELDLPADPTLPAPKPPKELGRSDQPASPPPESRVGTSSEATETPRGSDRVRDPIDAPAQPTDSASGVDPEAQGRPPASANEELTSLQLRQTKEMIAHLIALISKRDFATAVNSATTFRNNNPGLAKTHRSEYRELLKLERTATKKYFGSPSSSGRRPSYDTGDLDVAVIDHDLMIAYLRAAMPTFAREHFLNAEQGYQRALAAARQRERTASGGSSAKRDIQQLTENLGLLYVSWADYKPDESILRKADAAFWDSERLLDYAEDTVSAKRRLVDGKASVERVRRWLSQQFRSSR